MLATCTFDMLKKLNLREISYVDQDAGRIRQVFFSEEYVKKNFLEPTGVSDALKVISKFTNSFQVSSFKSFSFCSLTIISIPETALQIPNDSAQKL